jgi:hypothetical protein
MITPSDATFAFEEIFPSVTCDREDLRMAWRDACADLRVAYYAWCEAAADGHAAEAFAAYVAAADREAAAADAFARSAAS